MVNNERQNDAVTMVMAHDNEEDIDRQEPPAYNDLFRVRINLLKYF